MAVSTQALVRDNSTLVNFKQWAKAISDFFTTAGWLQSGDTGQVNWSTIVSVPAVGTYVYEIWQPNDGLTNFYLKVEYGTAAGSANTQPQLRLSIGTATNGAGTLSGFVTGLQTLPNQSSSVTSTSIQWQCHFSGSAGRMGIMLWRDETNTNGPTFIGVQRSKNNSGADIGTYVTLISVGNSGNGPTNQQSLVFGVGVAVQWSNNGVTNCQGFAAMVSPQQASQLFNGSAAICPIFPVVGYFDNPMDIAAVGSKNDFTEGAQYVIASANMPYGVSHTYIATKTSTMSQVAVPTTNNNACFLMRYD